MNLRAVQHHSIMLFLVLAFALLLSACDGTDLDAPVVSSGAPTRTPTLPSPTPEPELTATPEPTATPEGVPAGPATPEPINDATHYTIQVQIDASAPRPISPLIYGVADPGSANEDQLLWLGATLARWGGNARTRHNWEINASNTGADGDFRNVSQGDNVPGSAALSFLDRNARLGLQSILTIPNIGWVARDKNTASQSGDVPGHGGPPVAPGSISAYVDYSGGKWIHPYDPTANRKKTSLPSVARKGSAFSYPPDLKDGKVYQDEWVAYLKSQRPATAAAPIYAMDNEPELWSDSTHVDIHPVRPGYDSMLATFLDYARAVKDADPAGLVAGPESWGVTGYMYSAVDAGTDEYTTAADRRAHGDLPWLAWFLNAVRESDAKAGQRALDILSLHYYPNGGEYTGGNDPETQDRRMQAPRALWDVLYVEQSWVARTEWRNLALLRRMNKMIEQYYPGTKLGITEWNFGGENDISGAIATADTLGIFGREDVAYASYWTAPPQDSPSGWAFRLYRNYDGQGAAFGSQAITVTLETQPRLTAYGALDATGDHLTVLLINKDRERSAEVALQPKEFTFGAQATAYRYGPADLHAIVPTTLPLADPSLARVSVPPTSMTLVALDRR